MKESQFKIIFNKNSEKILGLKETSLIEGESLKNGIWPRSFIYWLSLFYMALFIIRPWEKLFPWLGVFHFEKIYAIFMIFSVFLSHGNRISFDSQTKSVIVLFLSIFISAIFAVNPSLGMPVVYKYLTLVIFFFIILAVIQTPYQMYFFCFFFIVVMTLYLGKAEWEYFIHGAGTYRMGVWRLMGIESTFGGPNSVAGSIVLSMPITYFLWKSRKLFTNSWPGFWRINYPRFLVFYFILALSALVLTNSRSGMSGFIVFVLLIIFSKKGVQKKIGFVLLSVMFIFLVWSLMPQESKNRFETIWDPTKGPANALASARGRIEGFKAGLMMFKRYPLTGVGVGNFITYRVSHVDGVALQPHNLVGQVLGETGLVGAIAFLIFIVLILNTCRRIRKIFSEQGNILLQTLKDFSITCRNVILLLFYLGLFGHNLLRFNWLWLAAFCALSLSFTQKNLNSIK